MYLSHKMSQEHKHNIFTGFVINFNSYCTRTLLVYLFIRFARISYGRFIATRYNFKRSTYIQEPLVIGGVEYRERFKRETRLAADNGDEQSSKRPV
jgi:hypothetical protein